MNAVITFPMYDVFASDLSAFLLAYSAVIHSGHGPLGKVVDDLFFSRYLGRRLFGRTFRL